MENVDNKSKLSSAKDFAKKYKNWLIGLGIVLIALYAALSLRSDGYESLYSNLNEADKQEIVTELSKLGVDYKLDETGLNISVRSQDVSWVRTELTGMGLPSNSTGADGYDAFLESSLGSTKKDLELKELTARKSQLESELVRSFPFIESAVVNFDMAKETSIFASESEGEGKASVNIGLKNGESLTKQQLLGIQAMVSSAIPGVNSESVTVIDKEKGIISDEGLLEDGSTAYEKQMTIKSQTEKNIHDDIKKSLSSFFGYDNLQVNVNVNINFDEIVQNIEDYADEGVLRSTNRIGEETRKTEEGNIEAGTDANGEVIGYDIENGDDASYEQQKEDIIENFEISKTVETIKKNPSLTNTNVTVWMDEAKLNEKNVDVNQFRQAVGVAAGLTYNAETDTFDNGQVIIFSTAMEVAEVVEEEKNPVVGMLTGETGVGKFLNKYGIWLLIGLAILLGIVGILLFLLMKKKKKQRSEIENATLIAAEAKMRREQERMKQIEEVEEEIEPEDEEERKNRLKSEKKHKELSEKVTELSEEFPKETSEYIKKLLKERK